MASHEQFTQAVVALCLFAQFVLKTEKNLITHITLTT